MKKWITLLIILGVISGCEANEKTLHEFTKEHDQMEKLSPVLLEALSKSTNKTVQDIKVEDFLNIEELSLDTNSVPLEQKDVQIDLSVISKMKNLKSLTLYKINVKDYLFLKDLNELEYLSIIGFREDQLPTLFNSKLSSLSLDEGDLSDLKILQNSKSITHLSIRNNRIKDLSFIELPNVVFLDVSNNPITSIDFIKEIPNLGRLQIMNAPVTDIAAVQYTPKLEYLDIRGTKVTSIHPLIKLEELSILLVDRKSISDLHLLKKEVKVAENGYEIND
ncbi:leucine-rich repeat domain-containing protein [Brevibacillus sp. 179-C9.3 HS]|uniref:leucine-rich repeat domain-containing protein n=1 Tax=unclassified Brevibacillus TaxID=2684853 RepID=UPI0039A1A2B0